MCSTDFDDGECEGFESHEYLATQEMKCVECGLPIPFGSMAHESTWYYHDDWNVEEDQPLEGAKEESAVSHLACSRIAHFVVDQVCREDERREAEFRKADFHFEGYVAIGELENELEQIQDYAWTVSPEDEEEYSAMGFAVETEDTDFPVGYPADVIEWLWNLVKAEYKPVIP